MDLPELRDQLAEYLDDPHLASACLVCKSWNATFTPYLYRQVKWSKHDPHTPSVESLQKNAEHVRDLIAYAEPSELPLESFTKLEGLHHLRLFVYNTETLKRLSDIFSPSSGIKGIKEVSILMNTSELPSEFMASLLTYRGLRNLTVSLGKFDSKATELLLDACEYLEELALNVDDLTQPHSLDQWTVFPALHSLHLSVNSGMTIQNQLEWIQKCPKLEILSWSGENSVRYPVSGICEALSTRCPLVKDLCLEEGLLHDRDAARIIDSCAKLTSLSVFESGFGPIAFQSCSRHFSTLTRLDFGRCQNCTSAMSQRILTSCPNLTYYRATFLEARDIIGIADETTHTIGEVSMEATQSTNTATTTIITAAHPQDWVCLNLQSLTLFLCGLENKPEWQPQVLRQLSRLEKLDFLTIGPHNFEMDGTRDGIDLRLECGLDILGNLKRLERFCFEGLYQEMSEQDVSWMLEAWPELVRVEGKVHHSRRRRFELQEILEAESIALVGYFDDDEEDDEPGQGGDGDNDEEEEEEVEIE
ncbi:hypothetical protein BGZ80_010406 [Entomortierella chlamydospora]|uniref:F-box domain-containing protein n=1 Tax=Entomortierella chlamydospora TaxID=101097 RepID=A0A9P6N426_9FUNG|nr:hypothetical protein BGZ79_008222 [Entomortierella chlamydospora]KAG0023104.1 hypothetical protein BGZ80_010406 [Entomortierella chlamydospora]